MKRLEKVGLVWNIKASRSVFGLTLWQEKERVDQQPQELSAW